MNKQNSRLHTNISMKHLATIFFVAFLFNGEVSAGYAKAVNYFGDAWPVNYWNSNVSRADKDFDKIKSDGFNTVILAVPWGEFQPGLNPVRFNEDAFERLNQVCSKAKAKGLAVFMRVSYLHDMYPGVQMAGSERFDALMAGNGLLPAWKQYLAKIAAKTTHCSSGAFISWEDYWHSIETLAAERSVNASSEAAKNFGLDRWLASHASAQFKKENDQQLKSSGSYPVPSRKNPEFKQVFDWFNDQLINRLMPALKESIPEGSIEARIDDDPIYRGGEIVAWYSHGKSYSVASSPYLMTYWAPAMGAKNNGNEESAEKALERFSYINKKISNSTSNQIFIGQFLYKDSTPSASKNTIIKPSELGKFFSKMAPLLLTQTAGYALWGHRDYEASLLFNGSFDIGATGWNLSPGVMISKKDNEGLASLTKGASISQEIPSSRDHFRNFAKSVSFRMWVSGDGELSINYANVTKKVKVTSSRGEFFRIDFPVATGDSELKISADSGSAKISSIYLFSYVQKGEFRDPQGAPGIHFDDIKKLNFAIDAGVGMPSSLNAADNTLGSLSGVYGREMSAKGWYAWAGPQLKARIFPKSSTILLKGYIRPSMFATKEGCSISASLNGVVVSTKSFVSDEQVEMKIPVADKNLNSIVDLKLVSSCALNPRRSGNGQDERDLSYIINSIDLASP